MARVGFKKVLPAGTIGKAHIQALFGHLKAFVIDAGFTVLLDTPETVDFIRLGSPAGTAHDDVPHWAFEYVDWGDSAEIRCYPVYGNHFQDEGAYTHSYGIARCWRQSLNGGWRRLWISLSIWVPDGCKRRPCGGGSISGSGQRRGQNSDAGCVAVVVCCRDWLCVGKQKSTC